MLKIAGVSHDDIDKETIKGENIQNEIIKTRIKQLDSFIDLSQEIGSLLQSKLKKDNEEFLSNHNPLILMLFYSLNFR